MSADATAEPALPPPAGAACLADLDRDCLTRVLAQCSVRDVLSVACTCRSFREALKDDLLWRQLAEQKWGPAVQQLASVAPGGWQAWTRHRLSTSSHPMSPLDLVQEHYTDCPFQHLVACALCSRTSGGPAVRQAIRAFLQLWPTPSAVLEADHDSMLAVVHPLGLPAARLGAVTGLASGFLATDWQDPAEFKGFGAFSSDSFHIFCRGRLAPGGVDDRSLLRYLRWRAHGTTEEPAKPQQQRKRRAEERPAAAGTLRSGRRRGEAAPPAGERRQTRASAAAAPAAADAAAPKGGEGSGKQGRRSGRRAA